MNQPVIIRILTPWCIDYGAAVVSEVYIHTYISTTHTSVDHVEVFIRVREIVFIKVGQFKAASILAFID